jgi:predicted cupin superfamily sugar epimerase
MSIPERSAEYWIRSLDLQEHPEGGYFHETYRSDEFIESACLPDRFGGRRSFSTSIYFLLRGDQRSLLHRLKADETWYFHDGAALIVHCITPEGEYREHRVGLNIEAGEHPQLTIGAGNWFGATVADSDGYALVGCMVAPGFDFADFEMAERKRLIAEFPQHRALIERLTK